jgi:hypothetical protein
MERTCARETSGVAWSSAFRRSFVPALPRIHDRLKVELHAFAPLWRPLRATKGNGELTRKRTEKSFMVPKAAIVKEACDLSLNPNKEVINEEMAHRSPKEDFRETCED